MKRKELNKLGWLRKWEIYNMVNGYVQNRQQPGLEVLFEIAEILEVKPKERLKDKK